MYRVTYRVTYAPMYRPLVQLPDALGTRALYPRSSTAHCPKECRGVPWGSVGQYPRAMQECTEGVPLPNAPGQRSGYLRLLLLTSTNHRNSVQQQLGSPLPPSRAAVYHKNSTAESPKGSWQCTGGASMPTTAKQRGRVPHEVHVYCPTIWGNGPWNCCVHSRTA